MDSAVALRKRRRESHKQILTLMNVCRPLIGDQDPLVYKRQSTQTGLARRELLAFLDVKYTKVAHRMEGRIPGTKTIG